MKYSTRLRKINFVNLLSFAVIAASLSEMNAFAFFIDPVRCASDSVEQGAPAEGRNQWFKKCSPDLYDLVFSEGEFKINHTVYDRRLYVTYAVADGKGGFNYPNDWKAPTDVNAPCSKPTGYTAIGVCTSGCYAPGQKVLFSDGWESIEQATATKKSNVITLANGSTFEGIKTKTSEVERYLMDIRDSQQELLEISLLSGGSLEVTTGHPIVDGDGKMREASTFKVGESLIKASGESDPIVSIAGKTYFGKVYNLNVKTEHDLEQIIIAQGYLNGSLYYQSGLGVKKLNRILFRKLNIPSELIK